MEQADWDFKAAAVLRANGFHEWFIAKSRGAWRDSISTISALFACEHAPNSASRVRDVARVPRNQMQVHMHARLAARRPDIRADVVPVRRVPGLDRSMGLVQKCEHRSLFIATHIEEIRDMALRYYDDVSAA